MPKSDASNVHPHGPITELGENLWCVQGDVPGTPLQRWMTLARLSDGKLVVHNPVLLKKADMKRIDAWGTPRLLVVPGRFHRLDIVKFKQRYPDAEVVCPAGATASVEEVVPVDLSYAQVECDDTVAFEHLDGTEEREGVFSVETAEGKTLVFNDVLFNMPHASGFSGLILRLLGSTGDARVTPIAELFVVKDKPKLAAHLDRLAELDVIRLVPGHGDLVEQDASEVLYRAAVRL